MNIYENSSDQALKAPVTALLALFALVSLVVLVSAYGSFRFVANQLDNNGQKELDAFSKIKVTQIEKMLAERHADADVFVARPSVWKTLSATDVVQEGLRLNKAVTSTYQSYGYRRILVVDKLLQVIASVTSNRLEPVELSTLQKVIETHQSAVVDLHFAMEGDIVFGIAHPIYANDNENDLVVGAVYLELDARQNLFPILESQPTFSLSMETILVRREEGNEVLFLSPLRFMPNISPLSFRLPIGNGRETLAERTLVDGKFGLLTGYDYRGVEVLGDNQRISGTSWIMMTKVDRTEIDYLARVVGVITLVVASVLLLLLISIFWLLWRKKSLVLLAEQAILMERHGVALRTSIDGYLVVNQAGRIIDCNAALSEITGYSTAKITTLYISDLEIIESPDEIGARMGRIMASGSDRFTTRWRRKDGEIIDIEVSTAFSDDRFFTFVQDITERQRANAALKESEGLLEVILDGIPDSLVLIDSDGKIAWANPAMYDLHGISPDRPLSEIEDFIPLFECTNANGDAVLPEEWPAMRALKGEPVSEFELHVTRQDTGKKWIGLYWALPIYYKRKIQALIGINDITERKRAEIALRENQNYLKLIFTSATNGLLVANADGKIVMINPALETLLGYAANELIGQPVEVLIPTAQREKHVEQRQVFFRNPSNYNYHSKRVLHAQHREGRELPIELSLNRFDSGEEKFTLAIVVDITERIRAQTELERSRENWRNLAEAMPHIVWACTPDGGLEYVSQQWWVYTGETDITRWFDHIHPEDRDRIQAVWIHSLQTGENYDLEGRIRRHDGVYRWFKVRGTPVRNSEGQIVKWHGCNIDIEGIKQAEQAAQQSNRTKGEFLANMSHEIRTPMNAIIGLSYLCMQTGMTNQQLDYLRKIHNSANTLLRLLNDILDFSKIEAGKLDLEHVNFSLEEVLNNLASVINVKASEKGLELFLDTDVNVPSYFVGDPLRLGQILINLSNNAVKFTEKGAVSIIIKLLDETQKDVLLQFTVCDTGIGMTQAQQERLFQAFSQVDSSTTRKYGGTGLGLIISKQLVEMMKGEIYVESALGIGSRFIFTVRLEKSLEEMETSCLPSPGRYGLKYTEKMEDSSRKLFNNQNTGVHLLLVEDNEINQQINLELLEKIGVRLTIAENGKEAIEATKKGNFDGILMDIQMPIMDGYEATREIRKIPAYKDVPIIAITANAMPNVRDKCLDAGMNDYIDKPVVPAKLYNILAKWIQFDLNLIPDHTAILAPDFWEDIIPLTPLIPGIDATRGLKNMGGNTKLYQEVLLKFSGNQRLTCKQMEKSFASKDAITLGHLAHSLKGVAAAIGAVQLADLADKIEGKSRIPGGLDDISELIEMAKDKLEQIVFAIETKIQKPELIIENKQEIAASPEELTPLFHKAIKLLISFDSSIENIVERLVPLARGRHQRKMLKSIQLASDAYDFELCLNLFRDWAKEEGIQI
ncbi:two-component system, sensor histidine kinase and response regulator [Gammaproteobacteria bacterium]